MSNNDINYIQVYKIKNYLAPPYTTKLLSNVSDINSYNIRASLSGDLSFVTEV